MSTLKDDVVKLAYDNPGPIQKALLPILKAAASKPRSAWDQKGVFGWATPAPNVDGSVPEPWRVSHNDVALAWLKGLFKFTDLYSTYESRQYRGKLQLLVGLRDNRNRKLHQSRIASMFTTLKKLGFPVRMPDEDFLLLVDDLNRDALRR